MVFRDPNDQAYVKEEHRKGPPLDYVAEKLRESLQAMHTLHGVSGTDQKSPDAEGRSGSIRYAFHNGLRAYLALVNLLALANDQDLAERLLGYSCEEFDDWLARVTREGSVTDG